MMYCPNGCFASLHKRASLLFLTQHPLSLLSTDSESICRHSHIHKYLVTQSNTVKIPPWQLDHCVQLFLPSTDPGIQTKHLCGLLINIFIFANSQPHPSHLEQHQHGHPSQSRRQPVLCNMCSETSARALGKTGHHAGDWTVITGH